MEPKQPRQPAINKSAPDNDNNPVENQPSPQGFSLKKREKPWGRGWWKTSLRDPPRGVI